MPNDSLSITPTSFFSSPAVAKTDRSKMMRSEAYAMYPWTVAERALRRSGFSG